MSTVKISDLVSAIAGDIANPSDVIIINAGDTTKKITVNNFLAAAGATVSGSLIPVTHGGATTSSFDLGSPTAAWKELYVSTASINFVDSAGTITKFTKADITNLKEGKSLRTGSKQIVHESDDTTFVQMKSSTPGKVVHSVSNRTLLDMTTGSFKIGEGRVPLTVTGANININASQISFTGSFSNRGSSTFTGSFDNSGSFSNEGSSSFSGSFGNSGSFESTGSFTSTGSFVVNNLLDLLANFGQTGIPTGSGEGGVAEGDINFDGQVNVNDLLLLLAGYGNPNQICNNQTIPPNVNHQFVGPTISVCDGNTLSISTGSFCSITF